MRSTDVTRSSASFAANGAVQAGARVTVGGSRGLWRLIDVVFTMLERHKQRRALMNLDEHQLKDIGISRSEVDQEVTKPFWRG